MSTDTMYNGTVENDSTVNGFNMMIDESLSALSERMGLSTQHKMLCICREHYKAANKNPTVDELLFIDGYIKEYRKHSEFSLIGEFVTDSKNASCVYSDLVEARKALSAGKAKYPFALSEAARTASWLCENEKATHSKKNNPCISFFDTLLSSNENKTAETVMGRITEKAFSPFDASCTLSSSRQATKHNAHPSLDGLFASVILPTDLCDNDEYRRRATDALTDEKVRSHIAESYTLCVGGISLIHALVTHSNGAKLYSDCFFSDGEPSLHGIFGIFDSRFLVFSKGPELSRLSKELEKFGLCITVAGECDNSNCISLSKGNTVLSSIDISLIKKLTESYPERFVYNEDRALPVGCKTEYSDVFLWNDSIHSIAVKNEIDKDVLMSAYSTVYTAYGKAVCEGFANNIALTCDLSFSRSDSTDESRGSRLATVLGLFASQTELSVISKGSKIHSEDIEKTCLTVFVTGDKTHDGVKDKFFDYNNNVYLLRPTQDDKGFVVPESMKALCEYVRELIALGKVRSVLPFGGCTVVDALNRTVNGDVGYFLSTKEDIHAALPFAFIIETNTTVEGIKLGTTCKVTKETMVHNSDRVWRTQNSQSDTAESKKAKKNNGSFGKVIALVAVFSFLAVSSCVSKAHKKKKRADKSKKEKDKEKKTKE